MPELQPRQELFKSTAGRLYLSSTAGKRGRQQMRGGENYERAREREGERARERGGKGKTERMRKRRDNVRETRERQRGG